MAHCSPFNPVRYKGKKKEILALLNDSKRELATQKVSKKVLCSYFTDPRNYTYVIEKFPKLKICLAHFGSEYMWEEYYSNPGRENNWFVIIKDLISKSDNFYTDISFTLNNKKFFPLVKVLMADPVLSNRILFGSDYYMVETETDERRFGIELRGYLGESLFHKIAYENPRRFLGIDA